MVIGESELRMAKDLTEVENELKVMQQQML